jgi:hypothetical protein
MDTVDPQSKRQRNNRRWILLGVGGCLGLVCLCAAFAAGIGAVVFGAIRSTDVYQEALARARANPAVVEALGEPIEPGWWVTGSIETTGNLGDADFTIPVSGPNGSGRLNAVARKSGGPWEFFRLEVVVDGRSQPIDLLNAGR